MKKYEDIKTAICPKCGQEYTGRPALSRADNKTMICPDCGIHEALENIGVGKEVQSNSFLFVNLSTKQVQLKQCCFRLPLKVSQWMNIFRQTIVCICRQDNQ